MHRFVLAMLIACFGASARAGEFFGSDKLWTFHLTVAAKDWEAMQPTKGGIAMFGAPAMGKAADKDARPPEPGRGGFGFDFAYVKGSLEFDGKTWSDIGVRFKGNSSYAMAGQTLKRPFKIDFDRYGSGRDFQGLKMISLSNNFGEPSQLREALAFAVFRAAGVPAPRTAFVELFLTVPGKYDRELLGLYTLVEQVNKTFLKSQFKNGNGMLLKPEGIAGVPYLGSEWKPYDDWYRPKAETETAAQKRLMEFARLVNFADDASFNDAIGGYLDVDKFLRYLAACSLSLNADSFIGVGHNYYLYLSPKDGRFVYIPWDLNATFGILPLSKTGLEQAEWSIQRPYLSRNRLTERLLAVAANEAAYRKHLLDLSASTLSKEKMLAEIERMQATVKPAIEREALVKKKGGGLGLIGLFFPAVPDLKEFVVRRSESIAAQFAGTSKGREISMGSFGPQSRGSLGSQLAKPILVAVDKDSDAKISPAEWSAGVEKLLAQWDPDQRGMTETALADAITKAFPRRPASLFRAAGTSNPLNGNHLAGYLFVRIAAKDNLLQRAALSAFADRRFQDADSNKDGILDERELTAALNELPPIPAVIGRPGDKEEPKKAPAK